MRKRKVTLRKVVRRYDHIKRRYADVEQTKVVSVYGETRKDLRLEQARKQTLYERGLL